MARAIKAGEVFVYPYLWGRQSQAGETEGRKERPVCVALSVERNGVTHVFLLAITSTQPAEDQIALEIPETEAYRVGLRAWKLGWVIVGEGNYDIAERSFYLDLSQPPLGRFSDPFTKRIRAEFRKTIEKGDFKRVDRTE